MSEKLTEADDRAMHYSHYIAILDTPELTAERVQFIRDNAAYFHEVTRKRLARLHKELGMLNKRISAKDAQIKSLVDDVCLWRSRAEAMAKWAEDLAHVQFDKTLVIGLIARRPTWPDENAVETT